MTLVSATKRNIARAGRALRAGGLVAFPTETVYGLGADACNGEAVARIFEMKGRPRFNPLIVHLLGVEAAETHAAFTPLAQTLADAFWPGPLTLVLERRADSLIADLVTAGLETIAVRAPSHPVARGLLHQAGVPIAAPSANKAGHVSPTTAAHVHADLGDGPDYILDGGPAPLGLESTVIDATGAAPVLLRPGAIAREAVEEAAESRVETAQAGGGPSSPGQLSSHYAPRTQLRLAAASVKPGEALLAFGPDPLPCDGPVYNLSEGGDLREAAANFFSGLRELDASGAEAIAVMPVPDEGLGEAINDRLRRAAEPHEDQKP